MEKSAFTLDFQFIIAYNSIGMKLENKKISSKVRMMFNLGGSFLFLRCSQKIFKFKIIQTLQGGK